MSGGEQHRFEMPGVEPPPAINPHARRVAPYRPTVDELWNRLQDRDRSALSLAITWLESTHPRDQDDIAQILDRAQSGDARSLRLGITGVPGSGKSTLIESLGLQFLSDPEVDLAVLAIDPSSPISGGSILGDKSRMVQLSRHPRAFVRPSPSRGTLGGVGGFTHEAIALCEAAGKNLIIVETVGVGQSEATVRDMVDVFLLLMLTGAGDDLQGMKRGVLELADILAVTKADGENKVRAGVVCQQLRGTLGFFMPLSPHWSTQVETVSVHDPASVSQLRDRIRECETILRGAGEFDARRATQRVRFALQSMETLWQREFMGDDNREELLGQVRRNELTPRRAAQRWWDSVRKQ